MNNQTLLSRGMIATMFAQFFSACADNALLFAILALIKTLHYPEWSKPILQMVFVLAFIISAPFVGQIADRFSKGRVMLCSNAIKLFGAFVICIGISPFLGYALVGIGAACYSPAKYGILGELTNGDNLVKANGLIEASTIAAILLGSVAGGYIADLNVFMSILMCILMFTVAMLANLFIPKLAPARTGMSWNILAMVREFIKSAKILLSHQQARITLIGTSLFWGAGITLRFLLIDWVPIALGISDNKTPTILNAVVAIGIVIGAGLAAKFVSMKQSTRCIPAGILMGIAVICFSVQSNMAISYLLLIIIGALGGYFLVPLNALLQNFGKQTIGAGSAIAVQNCGEYSGMMIMLGLYSMSVALGFSTILIGVGFGVLFSLAITSLWLWQKRK
ncbi:lysophospholipid transporter LplT [Orbus wheelerorum]|uniref:lysophospholipid transporter LplT n=1 Tax=Orbus wheelerorum TaxID=3074111 RepID=UPI00370DCABA